MFRFTHILSLVLALSVVMAGFPVQAKPQCSMVSNMQIQSMEIKDIKDCQGCAKTADEQDHHKRKPCCGDRFCAAKCSSISNAGPVFLCIQHNSSLFFAHNAEPFDGSNHVLSPDVLIGKDWPPKYLS